MLLLDPKNLTFKLIRTAGEVPNKTTLTPKSIWNVDDLPWDIPAATTAPEWIIGPSFRDTEQRWQNMNTNKQTEYSSLQCQKNTPSAKRQAISIQELLGPSTSIPKLHNNAI